VGCAQRSCIADLSTVGMSSAMRSASPRRAGLALRREGCHRGASCYYWRTCAALGIHRLPLHGPEQAARFQHGNGLSICARGHAWCRRTALAQRLSRLAYGASPSTVGPVARHTWQRAKHTTAAALRALRVCMPCMGTLDGVVKPAAKGTSATNATSERFIFRGQNALNVWLFFSRGCVFFPFHLRAQGSARLEGRRAGWRPPRPSCARRARAVVGRGRLPSGRPRSWQP
jgi:hypothetical protein